MAQKLLQMSYEYSIRFSLKWFQNLTKLSNQILLDRVKQTATVGEPFKMVGEMLVVPKEAFADQHNPVGRVPEQRHL